MALDTSCAPPQLPVRVGQEPVLSGEQTLEGLGGIWGKEVGREKREKKTSLGFRSRKTTL